MSWRYSMPYGALDGTSSQSKFGTSPIPTPKFGSERQSRWSSSNSPAAEPAARSYRVNGSHEPSPMRAKASISETSSVVQRLKERYSTSNSSNSDGDKLTSSGIRPYGRSLTTLSVGKNTLKPRQTSYDAESRRDYGCSRNLLGDGKSLTLKIDSNPVRSVGDKTPEAERPGGYEQRFKRGETAAYSPASPKTPTTYTSRFMPSMPVASPEKPQEEKSQDEGEVVTVVARGTSPSQTTTSIYLRTRRADFGIEKKIHRPKIKPPFSHKETQTDRTEDSHLSRFAYSDLNSRVKPWAGGSSTLSTASRFSSRSSYKSEKEPPGVTSPTRTDHPLRCLSRESSGLEPRSPSSSGGGDSPRSPSDSLAAKPPTSFRSTETLKLNLQKPGPTGKEGDGGAALRKPSPSSKTLKTDAADDEAGAPTPKKISPLKSTAKSPEAEATRPGPKECAAGDAKKATAVNGDAGASDSSSMSESSSEDDTSSGDEEVERIKASETSFVKRSITNFLQNKPIAGVRKQPSTADAVCRSKSGAFHRLNGHLGPPPKITFNRVESGERAWWLDSSEPVPEGVVKIFSNCCLGKQEQSTEGQGNDRAGSTTGHPNSFVPDSNTNPCSRLTTYLINRQFTTDIDWLKDGDEEERDGDGDAKWGLDGNNNISRRGGSPGAPVCEGEAAATAAAAVVHVTNCDAPRVTAPGTVANGAGYVNVDNVCSTWLRDTSNFACANIDKSLQKSKNEVTAAQLHSDSDESIDVTPGLRRRREQNRAKTPDICSSDLNHQPKVADTDSDAKKYSGDTQPDMKERQPNAVHHQNGIASPVEEKNGEVVGDMSGLISKAKAGLIKSKTKLDVRKSSSREMSPKHEIDLYWKELVDSINRPLKLCDLDFTDLVTDDDADVLGNRREEGEIPPPPPMLILPPAANGTNARVPAPPTVTMTPPVNRFARAPAPPPPMTLPAKNKKTVKLFWKEVKDEPLATAKPPGVVLIWDELVKVSVDTQKLEQLFESRAKDLITKKQHEQNKSKEIIVLDHKRSNAINIGMTKLPPPRAIKTAILKMDSTVVNKEGIEKLLTMLPTDEERLRIQDAQSSNPDLPLGSAEQFLLILASISELEARLKLWAFKLDFENSEKEICEPLMDLKQGIEILRTNKTFRAILSTLLSIGNFLNGCDVKGFQIDYLSKVPEVKDTVQKHSLLHHLCAIVMEKFPDSTDLYSEIGAVTRASKVDFDELTANIKKIEEECKLSWSYLKMIAKHEGHTAMKVKMSDFLADCAERIIVLGIVHKRIMSRFHKFIYWLGTPVNRITITRPNEIFKVISEFALEYRTTRERILQQIKKMSHREKSRSRGCLAGDAYDGARKMNSKEAKDDAKLRQLLSGGDSTYSENMHKTSTWRRHRKDTRNLIDLTNNDDEIIETLIKTANQIPSHRPSLKDRRRSSRVYERKG